MENLLNFQHPESASTVLSAEVVLLNQVLHSFKANPKYIIFIRKYFNIYL